MQITVLAVQSNLMTGCMYWRNKSAVLSAEIRKFFKYFLLRALSLHYIIVHGNNPLVF